MKNLEIRNVALPSKWISWSWSTVITKYKAEKKINRNISIKYIKIKKITKLLKP